MQNETITIEYAGPSKNNPKFGSIKTNDNRWFSCPIGMLPQFTKGATVNVVTESKEYNGKTFYNIRGMAQPSSPTPTNTQSTSGSAIPREAAMAAMAVIGKLYEGTGTFPGAELLADQFLATAHAWMMAEDAYKEGKSRTDPADEIAPF